MRHPRSGRRRAGFARLGTLTLLTGLALLLGSAPAWAHSRLESSDPADGTSLATAPQKVSLTFNEPVQAGFTTITVIGPDGADYHTGTPTEVDDTVSIGVLPLGPAGAYKIGYRVVSADGHPVSGSVGFTMTTAGTGSAAGSAAATSSAGPAAPSSAATTSVVPTSTPPDDGGAPVWPWVVGGIVLVAVGVVAALRLGRS
jgi:copper resistance protein C